MPKITLKLNINPEHLHHTRCENFISTQFNRFTLLRSILKASCIYIDESTGDYVVIKGRK